MSATDPDAIDIFISYAREDRACAGRFARALGAGGWRVWWDEEIDVGADFGATLEARLRHARTVLVLWSASSVQSGFVKDEAARARDSGKLHPIRIADVSIPLGFGHIQTVDLFGCTVEGPAFAALVEDLSKAIARGPAMQPVVRTTSTWRRLLGSRSTWLLLAIALVTAVLAYLIHGWRVERRCTDAFVRTDAGLQRLLEGSAEQAIDHFTEAIRMCGSRGLPYRYRGEAYARLNAFALAVTDLERALSLGLEGYGQQRAEDLLRTLTAAQAAGALPIEQADTEAEMAPHDPVVDASSSSGGRPGDPPLSGAPPPPAPPPPSAAPGPGRPSGRPPAATGRGSTAVAPRAAGAAPDTPSEVDDGIRQRVSRMFTGDKDARIEATTAFALDPKQAAGAVPLAVQTALQQPDNKSGVINTLVLLRAVGPAELRRHAAAIERLLERAPANGPQTAALAQRVRAALSPRVYIHITDPAQQALAARLRRQLEARGFEVVSVENVGGAAAGVPRATPEVRLHGDSARGGAQAIGAALQEAAGVTPRLLTIRKAAPPRDTYEIWLDVRTCVERQAAACRP